MKKMIGFIITVLVTTIMLPSEAQETVEKKILIAQYKPIFATLSDSEKTQTGYILVNAQGQEIPMEIIARPNQYVKIKSVLVEFYGCYYANDEKGGFLSVTVNAGNEIAKADFEINNRMNDHTRYTQNHFLKKYTNTIKVDPPSTEKLSSLVLFLHPGYWAIVARDLKVFAIVE